jgi:hypothetical protein
VFIVVPSLCRRFVATEGPKWELLIVGIDHTRARRKPSIVALVVFADVIAPSLIADRVLVLVMHPAPANDLINFEFSVVFPRGRQVFVKGDLVVSPRSPLEELANVLQAEDVGLMLCITSAIKLHFNPTLVSKESLDSEGSDALLADQLALRTSRSESPFV